MPSRPDIPLVLVVLGSVLIIAKDLVYPSGQASALLTWLGFGITVAIFLYAVFWGLVVRRGMAVSLYRNQALGVSLLSLGTLYVVISSVSGFLFNTSSLPWAILVGGASYGLLIFFWVDASMRASQDMDPLSRDSLRWSKLRYVLWGLIFVGIGVQVGFLALTGFYGFFNYPQPGSTGTIIDFLAGMPVLVPFLAGVALPIGALRSRDRSFRRQLQWFALALLLGFGLLILALFVFANNIGVTSFLYPESFLVVGYCFYRSARALVPLSSISSD